MEVKEVRIKYRSRKAEYHLYPLGDIHAGIKHCGESMLKRQINLIKNDPLALVVGMGDYAECITPSDPRWDTHVIADWVDPDNIAEDQTQWVADVLSPVQDKIIGLLEGNHEDSIRIHSHVDVQKNLCKRLEVDNLGYSCFVRLAFTRNSTATFTVVCFFSHGAGWAITKGAKLNRLQRTMDSFEADIYAIGHMHDIITDTKPYLSLGANNKIQQKEKVGAVTGSWFKTYEQGVRASYGEKKNYPPTTLGCPMFTIVPDKMILKVEG